MSDSENEISAAIEQLRSQLAAAQEQGQGERLKFTIVEAEMEFLVDVVRDAQANGGLRLGLVTLGGHGSMSQGTSHRLKLRLEVMDTATGHSAEVSDRR